MENEVVEKKDIPKDKLSPYDEQEAYFILCEIFARAQSTQNRAQFEYDLSQWKKRFSLEAFSEAYKIKIKYMLSEEFLNNIIKNFSIFMKQAQKDPAEGLEKLRKILDKAEKNKDKQQFKADIKQWDMDYSSERLKNIYPHIIGLLLSKANIARVFQKFDSNLAFTELKNITQNPQDYKSPEEFTSAIEEWKKLYPIADFNDKYRGDAEKLLTEALDSKNLEALFPVTAELDLSEGEVIPIELHESVKSISKISKDALHDFFKIVDKNKGDINSLFDWICKYDRYINTFDAPIKAVIVENLMSRYAYELPPVGTIYKIPKMQTGINDLLSLSEFNNIDDTKKQVVLQLLGILSTDKELTNEDIYQLNIINANVMKSEMIKGSTIEQDLEDFMKKNPEDSLTPHDEIYIEPNSATRVDVSIEDDVDLTLHKDDATTEIEAVTVHKSTTGIAEIEEATIQEGDPTSFKEAIKVVETVETQIITSNSTSTSDSGAAGGGTGISIAKNEATANDEATEITDTEEKKNQVDNTPNNPIPETPQHETSATPIRAIVLESEPTSSISSDISENENASQDIVEEEIITEPEEEAAVQTHPIKDFFNHLINHDSLENDERDDR